MDGLIEKNILYDIQRLNHILDQGCFLFGAGRVSRTVVQYAAKRKYVIQGILVSEAESNPQNIMGVRVSVIKDVSSEKKNRCLVACVMENLHEEVYKDISPYNFAQIFYISDKLFYEINYILGSYDIENMYSIERVDRDLKFQKSSLLRFVPRPCLEYLVLNILDHCNLRCKGCDHFACVADPYNVSYETIHRDLDRLAEIFHGDYIMKIAVMGGEPLLHPELLKILKDVRKHFPYTTIRLTTNGLLLLKQGEEFWRVCREEHVTIVNTKYPLNLDYEKMKEKAIEERVNFQFFEGTGDDTVKKSFKKIINLKGDSDPAESFSCCHISNYGNFLMEGKFYGCPFSCQSYRIFNKKFNKNLRMTEQDFIDIYKVHDMREILEFAARPKYYCRYCTGLSPLFDWSRSNGVISEWVNGEE